MAQVLSNISIILFVIAVVFAIGSIVIWFVFKIPEVIGDLSGRNARKSIEHMRAETENKNNNKKRSLIHRKAESGMISNPTETMGGISKQNVQRINDETGLLSENAASVRGSTETALLTEEDVTASLETGELGATQLMDGVLERKPSSIKLRMINEVMIINTKEAI